LGKASKASKVLKSRPAQLPGLKKAENRTPFYASKASKVLKRARTKPENGPKTEETPKRKRTKPEQKESRWTLEEF
jgi:hypothetical protein